VWYDLPVDTRDHPFLQHDGPIAFAHRGGAATLRAGRVVATGSYDWGENTMAAFQRALDMGFRYLETDVHATRDGVLLAFHDRNLSRVTGEQGRVGDVTFDELRRLKVTGLHAIPPLAEVLAAFPEAYLNIDVKAGHAIGPLLDVLRTSDAWDRVCVASFSDRRVRAVRAAAGPRLATSMGPRDVAALRLASLDRHGRLDARVPRGAACVQVPVRLGRLPVVDDRLIETAHRLGLPIHAWVIDDPPTMTWLLDLGVDGIMSDDLDALRDVLVARDAWPYQPRPDQLGPDTPRTT